MVPNLESDADDRCTPLLSSNIPQGELTYHRHLYEDTGTIFRDRDETSQAQSLVEALSRAAMRDYFVRVL